jgi:hypothetical protein
MEGTQLNWLLEAAIRYRPLVLSGDLSLLAMSTILSIPSRPSQPMHGSIPLAREVWKSQAHVEGATMKAMK